TEQLGRHQIAAAAAGKQLDHLGVGKRDDEDGQGCHQGESDGQVRVLTQGLEGFLGTVGGGGEAVGSQATQARKATRVTWWKTLGSVGSRAFPTSKFFRVLGKVVAPRGGR